MHPGIGSYFYKYLGEAGNWFFMHEEDVVRRSGDCGLHWEDCPAQLAGLPVTSGAVILSAASGNGRFYLYSGSAGKTIWHTTDGGNSWGIIQTPKQIERLIVRGDTLLVVHNTNIARTTDLGATWTNINLPNGISSPNVYIQDHNSKLLAIFGGANFKLSVSTDDGATWTQTCADFYNYDPGSNPSASNGTAVKYIHDGVIFIHAARGLYLSKNDGVNWLRLAGLPFLTEFPPTVPGFEGAWEYLLKDDYLYASSFWQGVWRTPWQPILEALNSTQQAYGMVEGRVFRDRDDDCTFSAGDGPIAGQMVRLSPDNVYTTTANDGTYRFAASAGNYLIETILPDNTVAVCNPLQMQAVTLAPGATASAFFPMFVVPGIVDLCLNLYRSAPLRPGFGTSYVANVANVGSEPVSSAVLSFQFDPALLQFVSSNLPVQIAGGTLTFLIPTLLPYESLDIHINFEVPASATLGQTMQVSGTIVLPNDAHPNNNYREFQEIITGAYDPNDKSVAAAGPLTPGSPHALLYVIRFQRRVDRYD